MPRTEKKHYIVYCGCFGSTQGTDCSTSQSLGNGLQHSMLLDGWISLWQANLAKVKPLGGGPC